MPFANLRTVRLHYEVAGPDDASVIVLSHSLGADLSMWNAQVAALSQRHRVVRYDTRGHGQSSLPSGPHGLSLLVSDVLDLLDYLSIRSASFCGLSLGGLTGLALAQTAPKRLNKLVVCSSATKIGTYQSWDDRIDLVRREGMAKIVPGILERWFTPAFRSASPEAVQSIKQTLEQTSSDGYVAGCIAVRDADFRGKLGKIEIPTLIATGTEDPVAPPSDGRTLAAEIPRSHYAEFPGAHLFNIESSQRFTAETLAFLAN